eukprot:TRINITY_DN2600_c0_g1_i2.p1 TRINITY_DN2600_c0_g1~~TRINITY_DN2600_c0_g1_i2.p1  ORF type:complete len:220 (-),score=38.66 TRINITY_DN2600_c0_g1_i2:773-1432(-)
MEDQALFRLFNPLSPTTRRTTRVLQEMQAQRGINGIFAIDEMRITNSPTLTTLTPTMNQILRPANTTATPTNTNQVLRTANFVNMNTNNALFQNNALLQNNADNTPPQNNSPLIPERRRLSGNFDDSFGQNGSPDEMVIQARGRRQVPLTFSPDINHTPLRQQMQRAKLAAMSQSSGSRLLLPNSNVRTSPRKRLTLSDTPPPQHVFLKCTHHHQTNSK